MRAAIVGAAGFLGKALAGRLLERGWEVVGYDLAPPSEAAPQVRFELLDVISGEIDFPRGTDAVFYLSQSPSYRDFPRAADQLFGVNTYGAIKAAHAAHAAGVRWFCYTSTGNVYAPSLAPLAEGDPIRRDEPYALSKLAAEESLALFAPHLPVLSARLFGLFGPGQQRMLPVKLRERILAGEPIVLEPAAGEAGEPEGLVVSFTLVADAARLLEQLAQKALGGLSLPAVLNVAGPEPVSLRRFASEIGRILGIQPVFVHGGAARTYNLIADLSRLRSVLEPACTPFAQAMAQSFGPAPVSAATAACK